MPIKDQKNKSALLPFNFDIFYLHQRNCKNWFNWSFEMKNCWKYLLMEKQRAEKPFFRLPTLIHSVYDQEVVQQILIYFFLLKYSTYCIIANWFKSGKLTLILLHAMLWFDCSFTLILSMNISIYRYPKLKTFPHWLASRKMDFSKTGKSLKR